MLLKWLSDRLAKCIAPPTGRTKGSTEVDLDHMSTRNRRLELARAAKRMGMIEGPNEEPCQITDSDLFEWSERR